jgi:NitT/TauT family transport system substrate-binding protein
MRRLLSGLLTVCLSSAVLFTATACDKGTGPDAKAPGGAAAKPPLKIAYSDWPGWVAWDIAAKKGWFKEAGVDVELVWLDYDASMKAFAGGQADAVCMTNGDAMVTGSSGKPSTLVVLNDYSNGNDMIVAKPGIESVKDLKGKKVGVELTLVDHLLLLKALEANGLSEKDVTLVGIATDKTPQALAASTDGVDAIAAWQPNSGQALKQVPGSKAIFTSKDVPGLIYDGLYVNRESLGARADDWQKVVNVWFKVVAYIQDPATRPDAVKIMAARVTLPPEDYAKLMDGTFFLDKAGNLKALEKAAGFGSVFGSSETVNAFNVAKGVYKTPADVGSYLESRLVKAAK